MEDEKPTMAKRMLKYAFYSGIVFTCTVPLYVSLHFNDQSTGWMAALCGGFITFMMRFDELSELTLGPLQAKMKSKIEEANDTVKDLRLVAATMAEATLSGLGSSFYATHGMPLKERDQLSRKVIASLKGIDVPRESIEKAIHNWATVISFEYVQRITSEIKNVCTTKDGMEKDNYNNAIFEINKMHKGYIWEAPTPSRVKAVLNHYDVSATSIDEWLADYEHYLATNEIRNEYKFFNSKSA